MGVGLGSAIWQNLIIYNVLILSRRHRQIKMQSAYLHFKHTCNTSGQKLDTGGKNLRLGFDFGHGITSLLRYLVCVTT